jgi:hypothetical protein
MTRHPASGAVERRLALSVNFLTSRQLEKEICSHLVNNEQ